MIIIYSLFNTNLYNLTNKRLHNTKFKVPRLVNSVYSSHPATYIST